MYIQEQSFWPCDTRQTPDIRQTPLPHTSSPAAVDGFACCHWRLLQISKQIINSVLNTWCIQKICRHYHSPILDWHQLKIHVQELSLNMTNMYIRFTVSHSYRILRRRLKSTPPPLYKEKQNITFIPYIFVLWNYTWTVAYCGQSMQKTSDRRTWPMCSASGPMNHFLHQTRMSNVSVLCGPKNFCIDCVEPLKFAMTFHTQLIHHKQMIKQSVFIVWIVLQNFLSTYFSEITNL